MLILISFFLVKHAMNLEEIHNFTGGLDAVLRGHEDVFLIHLMDKVKYHTKLKIKIHFVFTYNSGYATTRVMVSVRHPITY